jgi:hypothetical protein
MEDHSPKSRTGEIQMSWDPRENRSPSGLFLPHQQRPAGGREAGDAAGMCDEISERIVVHVSGISTLHPGFIYRNVRKAIHAYQPTYRRKSTG